MKPTTTTTTRDAVVSVIINLTTKKDHGFPKKQIRSFYIFILKGVGSITYMKPQEKSYTVIFRSVCLDCFYEKRVSTNKLPEEKQLVITC